MIKRLRRKFIIMATIGVLVVLGGALGLINTIAYMRMNQQVMSVLTYIIHNNGAVPQKIGGDDGSFFSDPSWTGRDAGICLPDTLFQRPRQCQRLCRKNRHPAHRFVF
jgi:hypothetical protein